MVRYHVPSVAGSLKLQRRCPHCNRRNGTIHSRITYRSISDPKVKTVAQRWMKCRFCKTTWTVRVEGIGHGRQRTDRLICIGVVLYMLGLSCRGVEQFLTIFGWRGSKSNSECVPKIPPQSLGRLQSCVHVAFGSLGCYHNLFRYLMQAHDFGTQCKVSSK